MLNQKIKILFIPILLATSQLIATDKLLPSDDDSLITPASRVDSVSSALTIDPPIGNGFHRLMNKLRYLSVSNGNILPWKDAISTFQRASTDGDEMPSLESIRYRILGEPLAIRRKAMVEKAFKSLFDPTPAEPLSLTSAPTPVLMPALSLPPAVSAPPTVTPSRSFSPFTIVFHPA